MFASPKNGRADGEMFPRIRQIQDQFDIRKRQQLLKTVAFGYAIIAAECIQPRGVAVINARHGQVRMRSKTPEIKISNIAATDYCNFHKRELAVVWKQIGFKSTILKFKDFDKVPLQSGTQGQPS